MFTPSKSPAFDYPTVNASQTALNQAAFSYDEQFTRAITIGQQQEISEIKKRNPQAILLVGDDRAGYTAWGTDAFEVCFCSGLPLRYKIKHLSDQPTSIKVSPQQLAQVIQRLTQCGNPASLINLETGEIDTYWPVASTYTYVHEEEIAPLPVMAVPTYNLPVAEDLGEFTAQYAEGELVPF